MISKNDRLVVETEQTSYAARTIMDTKATIEHQLSAIVTIESRIASKSHKLKNKDNHLIFPTLSFYFWHLKIECQIL